MTYRDDLEAAQARADALERENERLRGEATDRARSVAAERAEFEQRAAADRAELERQLQRRAEDEQAAAAELGVTLPSTALLITPSPIEPRSNGPTLAVFLAGTIVGIVGLALSFVPLAGIGLAIAGASIHKLGSRPQ